VVLEGRGGAGASYVALVILVWGVGG